MNDATQLSFGRRLRRLRAHYDLTQEALAELAACSVQAVRFFETGKRRPSVEMAERLAEVLKVPEDQRADFVRQARAPLPGSGDTTEAPESPPAPAPAQPAPPPLNTARLPQPATPLVGRHPETSVLRHLLLNEGARLVTLVGPGGVGKTRLALHMAHELAPCFDHGAVFVPLVGVFGASDIPVALAGALRASLAGDGAPAEQLDALLGGQTILLVLDNFEHLLAAEAEYTTTLVDHIIRHHPGVRLLITSRERLRLTGERIFELGGLGLPALNTPEDEEVGDAVELFVQRVRHVAPGFEVTPETLPAILRICHLLSGMPLGIELAAAWTRILTPTEIEVEITRSLDFLMLADRSAPPRHRSMRAVFEHSWQLLAPDEQRAAARLAVFRGGFRRETAQAVAGASLQHLAALIDKSLVTATTPTEGQEAPRRYTIHELLRQYLADKLAEIDDPNQVKRRHAEALTEYVEQIEQQLYENQSVARLRQIEVEQGNVRAALEWTLADGHDPALGLRLAGAMGRYWYLGGGWQEACDWLRRALAMTPADMALPARARALSKLGELSQSLSQYKDARINLQQALAIYRTLGDRAHEAWVLFQLGIVESTVGEYARAEALMQESAEIYRSLGAEWHVATVLMQLASMLMLYQAPDRAVQIIDEVMPIFRARNHLGSMGVAYNFQGWGYLLQGEIDRALHVFGEALTIGEDHGFFQLMGWSLRNMGMAYIEAGNPAAALDRLRDCLRLYQQMDFKSGAVIAFEGMAAAAAQLGHAVQAVRWLGVAEQIYTGTGQPRATYEEKLYQTITLPLTQAALNPETWAAALHEGRQWTMDQAYASALAG